MAKDSTGPLQPPAPPAQFPDGPTAAFWNRLFPHLGGRDPWTPPDPGTPDDIRSTP